MADAVRPRPAAVGRTHVGVAREGARGGVRSGQGLPLAVEAIRRECAEVTVPVFVGAFDEAKELVGALDAVNAGALEEIGAVGLLHHDDGIVEAAREVLDARAAAVEPAMVVGEKQIRVGVVADDPVVDPAFDEALGHAHEEVLRLAPRHHVRDIVGGREARLLRLEDKIPLLVRPEVEDLRGAVVVAGEMGIVFERHELGLRGLVPAGEIEVGHAPAIGRGGGGDHVPAIVVENDGGILHGNDGVALVGRRLDERAGGGPGQGGGKRRGGRGAKRRGTRGAVGGMRAAKAEKADACEGEVLSKEVLFHGSRGGGRWLWRPLACRRRRGRAPGASDDAVPGR